VRTQFLYSLNMLLHSLRMQSACIAYAFRTPHSACIPRAFRMHSACISSSTSWQGCVYDR
jgi:hypothetical protein